MTRACAGCVRSLGDGQRAAAVLDHLRHEGQIVVGAALVERGEDVRGAANPDLLARLQVEDRFSLQVEVCRCAHDEQNGAPNPKLAWRRRYRWFAARVGSKVPSAGSDRLGIPPVRGRRTYLVVEIRMVVHSAREVSWSWRRWSGRGSPTTSG